MYAIIVIVTIIIVIVTIIIIIIIIIQNFSVLVSLRNFQESLLSRRYLWHKFGELVRIEPQQIIVHSYSNVLY